MRGRHFPRPAFVKSHPQSPLSPIFHLLMHFYSTAPNATSQGESDMFHKVVTKLPHDCCKGVNENGNGAGCEEALFPRHRGPKKPPVPSTAGAHKGGPIDARLGAESFARRCKEKIKSTSPHTASEMS
ncbi:MAG: hypothetical protein HSCHL_0996 [Hydrogenibacillus schlegelii]|uniref:Uncharacterized protein n=1 Tax=Hydrogenibacillus schlegelii TaxID=1484 RepID=A0A2T5G6Q5_HYDSH|nr:MAG: hypothetical protein HSCHL_0996 [Hydrogenibacillus schlegelii]